MSHTLRLISVALLWHGDELLMMKRSMERTLSPGKWAGVGGHLEPWEINDPLAACLREVQEETGLRAEDVEDLKLRYILMRLNKYDLRQQFIYEGRARTKDIIQTDEGTLHWIPRSLILDRDLPFVFRELLKHRLGAEEDDTVWMGIATGDPVPGSGNGAGPQINWVPIVDPGLS